MGGLLWLIIVGVNAVLVWLVESRRDAPSGSPVGTVFCVAAVVTFVLHLIGWVSAGFSREVLGWAIVSIPAVGLTSVSGGLVGRLLWKRRAAH